MKTLSGRVALVTGSTSGIGLGIAKSLAEAGLSGLVLNGLADPTAPSDSPQSPVAIENLCATIANQFDLPVHFSPANMASPSEVANLIVDAEARFGRVDILVNNAGIQYVSPIEDFHPEKWDAILAINLSSAFHSIRMVLPGMRRRGWGRILNIASVHGLVASANKAAYVAAKHGLIGLTKTVALETATTQITCNAICPGWVLTPLVQSQIEQLAARENLTLNVASARLLAEKQPSGGFVTIQQIGASARFLCSEDAGQIRGTALTVDGAWTAQ